ncbi:hypothetical protein [Brevibacillus sp. SIMBA_076]|uniref:hypothetical protein n=1 Tax=Brevibacillus sp. SIMBA_076 TaxID=3085814 RepID=UPI003979FDF0
MSSGAISSGIYPAGYTLSATGSDARHAKKPLGGDQQLGFLYVSSFLKNGPVCDNKENVLEEVK